jgi:hypothetical protein
VKLWPANLPLINCSPRRTAFTGSHAGLTRSLPLSNLDVTLNKKNPAAALNTLQAASPIELGGIVFVANISCLYHVYVRGEAYLAAGQGSAAAAEFQKILDHSGIVWNCWTGALARLGVARGNALQAKTSQGADADATRVRALAAYKDFLAAVTTPQRNGLCDHVAVHIGTPLTRFGIDGTWVGANGYRSYFFFSVEPDDHRLCKNVQAPIERVVKSSTAATSFTTEAGQSYYFRTITPDAGPSGGPTEIVPIDPAEAQVLIASTAFSSFHLKK